MGPPAPAFLASAALVLATACAAPQDHGVPAPKRVPVIVDADTANEIDDLYAIVRALVEPRFEVGGLTSAQWHGPKKDKGDTVARSQELNEELLRLLGMESIPHPEGAKDPLPDAKTPRDSPAARHIIALALGRPAGEKLTVFVLGSFTNLASAVLLEPRIVPRIHARVIGLKYEPEGKGWDKDEFNSNNDRHAVEVLLNTPDLELTIMTATASGKLVYDREDVDRRLRGKGGLWDYLVDRWESHAPKKKKWIMWDVALIESAAVPALATLEERPGPPGNARKTVRVYTAIDVEGMKGDFWKVLSRRISPEP